MLDGNPMQSSTLQFTAGQLATTRALRKFCEVHGHAEGWLQRLDAVLDAVEAPDAPGLEGVLAPFTGGGMGSFIDWFPQPSSATEDDAYVEVLWNALYGHWREQMRPHWPARRG
jgi:predicted secreted protein